MKTSNRKRSLLTLSASTISGAFLCFDFTPALAQVLIEQWNRPGSRISYAWSGEGEIFQLQRRTSLDFGDWTDMQGGLTTTKSVAVEPGEDRAFFRVVDLSAGQPTRFAGGDLDDLRALSPDLTFDHLIVTGPLMLGLGGSVTLRASHFTLASEGSIGYSRGDCDHGSAPSLALEATGQINLGGNINLNGASGTRVTSSATCNSCYGENAGNLQITASQLRITGNIQANGGRGSSSVSDFGSSGCSGGNGGLVRIQAESIVMAQASLECNGGQGGTGYFQGDPNYGADGKSGELTLLASRVLEIKESELRTDGTATLEAPQTHIASPIRTANLQVSVNGTDDTTGPDIEILHPTSNATLPLDRPLTLVIHATDHASGVKELHVSGLGHDQVYPANALRDDRLTVVIARPEPPASLAVTVTDNRENHTSQTVSGLRLAGNLTIPSGDTYFLSDDLDLGELAHLVVEGTLEIPKSGEVKIHAGSLTLAAGGQVLARAPTEDLELALRPTLAISLTGDAMLYGTVDLTGHSSMAGRGYDYAQGGGHFTMAAANIEVSGSIILDGGYGDYYAYGWPAQYIRQGGGPGGTLRLNAMDSITVSGSLSVRGGDSGPGALGPCFDGGDAGQVSLTYGQQAHLSNTGGLLVNGGTSGCSLPGRNGAVTTLKRVLPPLQAADYLVQDELEPNGDPAMASLLITPIEAATDLVYAFAPLIVNGSIGDPDPGGLEITYGDKRSPISDLYLFSTPVDVMLNVELTWPSDADLELVVFQADTYEVVASAHTDAKPETFSDIHFPAGEYLFGIWAFDGGSEAAFTYQLRMIPTAFP